MSGTAPREGWEADAADWIAWARAPGHDVYWAYREAFFALLPPAGGAVLDVGCGEGRVSRDLAARGWRATGVDASPTLVAAAAEADPGGTYLVATGEQLPFADAAFPLVVAYNVLMDVQDMPRTVAECARVLEPGGALCACVVHPFQDSGAWEATDEGERFVVRRPYLRTRVVDERLERAGLSMRFQGFGYPLEAYSQAFEAAGLVLEALREPAGPPDRDAGWRALPMFLMLRARRPG